MYPHEAALAGDLTAVGLEELGGGGCDLLAAWIARGILEAHIEPPFAVEGDEQGGMGCLLEAEGKLALLCQQSLLEEDAAPLLPLQALQQLCAVGGDGVDDGHDELPEALAGAELPIDTVDPALHRTLGDAL